MRGFVTDRDLDAAEKCFPGIARFYRSLARKPTTFLELVWAYQEAKRPQLAHAA
jgi:hypothetical protein